MRAFAAMLRGTHPVRRWWFREMLGSILLARHEDKTINNNPKKCIFTTTILHYSFYESGSVTDKCFHTLLFNSGFLRDPVFGKPFQRTRSHAGLSSRSFTTVFMNVFDTASRMGPGLWILFNSGTKRTTRKSKTTILKWAGIGRPTVADSNGVQ